LELYTVLYSREEPKSSGYGVRAFRESVLTGKDRRSKKRKKGVRKSPNVSRRVNSTEGKLWYEERY